MASNDAVVLAAVKFPLGHRRYTILSKTKSKNCTSGASGVVKKEASDRLSDTLSDGVSDAWSDTSPALYDTPSDTPSDHVGRADRPPPCGHRQIRKARKLYPGNGTPSPPSMTIFP